MDADPALDRVRVEDILWPLVESLVATHDVAGLAVALVHEGETISQCFGVRNIGTRQPVMPDTLFHLASVSKPFVATAIVSLATARGAAGPSLDLDAPIDIWVPEFTLADGRQAAVTARGLLSHTSGLPDVSAYGWHDPQLDDEALSAFARSLSGRRLMSEPGSTFAYSNAGFELLGLLLSRVTGTTFENAVRQQVLTPLGMHDSTFLRAEVPAHLAASPHVGMPLTVPGDSYPYTRRHAPSSTLHSNLVELCRWIRAHLDPSDPTDTGPEVPTRIDPALLAELWRPTVSIGQPPWEEHAALGWIVGRYRERTTLGHSGADPGFGSRVQLVPERRTGVVVLANSNTVPTATIVQAALDLVLADSGCGSADLDELGEGVVALRSSLRSVAGPVGETLADAGPEDAISCYHREASAVPLTFDLDDDGFADAVWGAIELHRTDLVWPLLGVWTSVRPDSSAAWTMTGWANQVDGQLDRARSQLHRALELAPDNDDAALLLRDLPP